MSPAEDDRRFRFCPECGAEGGAEAVCKTCGTSLLRKVDAKGGASELESKPDAASPSSEGLEGTANAQGPGDGSDGWWTPKRKLVSGVCAGVITALVLVVVTLAIAGHNATADREAAEARVASAAKAKAAAKQAQADAAAQVVYDFNKRCVDLWNGDLNEIPRLTMSGTLAVDDKLQVSVGPSAESPEKCLITQTSPSTRHSSGQYNMQWLEGEPTGHGTMSFQGTEIPRMAFLGSEVGQIDLSDWDWNAHFTSEQVTSGINSGTTVFTGELALNASDGGSQ